jgi:hypothetical protein
LNNPRCISRLYCSTEVARHAPDENRANRGAPLSTHYGTKGTIRQGLKETHSAAIKVGSYGMSGPGTMVLPRRLAQALVCVLHHQRPPLLTGTIRAS